MLLSCIFIKGLHILNTKEKGMVMEKDAQIVSISLTKELQRQAAQQPGYVVDR